MLLIGPELKCDQYRELLEYALINGKPDFVELLINNAIHSTRFMNLDAFGRIYQQGLLYEMKHNQQERYCYGQFQKTNF